MKNLYTTSVKKYLAAAFVVVTFMFFCANTAFSQVRKEFTQRSSSYTPDKKIYSIKGDFQMIGNTNLSLRYYNNYTNNSNEIMRYVDKDGISGTENSSMAELTFSTEGGAIPECSNII